MKRYESLKEIFFQDIEKNVYGLYKQKAYFHSLQVATLCQVYARKRDLNIEIASVIGLFHDYSLYINHSSFQHGERSSNMIEKYLVDFSDVEKQIIMQAIRHHSEKEVIHDCYSELIKDMDLLAKYNDDSQTVFKNHEQRRIEKILSE